MIRFLQIIIFLLIVVSFKAHSIINGERVSSEYNNSVLLELSSPGLRLPVCTATIVGKRTILTAAHCVINKYLDLTSVDVRGVKVRLNGITHALLAHSIPVDYKGKMRLQKEWLQSRTGRKLNGLEKQQFRDLLISSAYSDFALLYTPYDIDESLPRTSVDFRTINEDIDVVLSGFGDTDISIPARAPYELHYGLNHLERPQTGQAYLLNASMHGGRAITAKGDSGGPLMSLDGKQIGVLSAGGEYQGQLESFYAPLASWKAWLRVRIR